MSNPSNTAILVFVKNLKKGSVKTRLAKDIGEDEALEVYRKLLAYTREVTSDIACDKFVFYSDLIVENDMWDKEKYVKRLQNGANLGDRMRYAFETILNEYDAAIIIGSDCPTITKTHINLAIESLGTTDYVIGPSEDGGYYLLGMNEMIDGFFDQIDWSTNKVFRQTFNKILDAGLTVTEIDKLSDIDYLEDWETYSYRLSKF